MKKPLLFLIFLFGLFFVALSVKAATLSLSPSSGVYSTGEIFTVDILLNTEGQPVDGVDIFYLKYNPSDLQVLDDDVSKNGVQIMPGYLMPMTLANIAEQGRITFSQITSGGTTFTNSSPEVLASVRFKVLEAADTEVKFDFYKNGTADTNVASKGKDVLTMVTNGSYGPAAKPSVPSKPEPLPEKEKPPVFESEKPIISEPGAKKQVPLESMPFEEKAIEFPWRIIAAMVLFVVGLIAYYIYGRSKKLDDYADM